MENSEDLPEPDPESRRGFLAAGLESSSSSEPSCGRAGRSIVIFFGPFLGLEDDVADGGGRASDDFFGGEFDVEATVFGAG